MAKTELQNETKTSTEVVEESNLKGTLISVFFVGFFLILTWLGVFLLFLSR